MMAIQLDCLSASTLPLIALLACDTGTLRPCQLMQCSTLSVEGAGGTLQEEGASLPGSSTQDFFLPAPVCTGYPVELTPSECRRHFCSHFPCEFCGCSNWALGDEFNSNPHEQLPEVYHPHSHGRFLPMRSGPLALERLPPGQPLSHSSLTATSTQ